MSFSLSFRTLDSLFTNANILRWKIPLNFTFLKLLNNKENVRIRCLNSHSFSYKFKKRICVSLELKDLFFEIISTGIIYLVY